MRHALSRIADMPIFETLLEQLPLGAAYLDAKLRFVHINARLAAMNGLPAAGHIGKSVLEIMPMLAASAEGIARRILETGQPEEVDVNEILFRPTRQEF